MDSERTDVIVPPDLPADELEAPKSEEGDTEQGDVDVLEHRATQIRGQWAVRTAAARHHLL